MYERQIHDTHVCCVYTQHTCVLCIYTTHMCDVYTDNTHVCCVYTQHTCVLCIYATHMCVVYIQAHVSRQLRATIPSPVDRLFSVAHVRMYVRTYVHTYVHMYVRTTVQRSALFKKSLNVARLSGFLNLDPIIKKSQECRESLKKFLMINLVCFFWSGLVWCILPGILAHPSALILGGHGVARFCFLLINKTTNQQIKNLFFLVKSENPYFTYRKIVATIFFCKKSQFERAGESSYESELNIF